MELSILVRLSIELCDEDGEAPAQGGPMEERMKVAAVEAVDNALQHFQGAGFSHDLDEVTAIEVREVRRWQ